MDEARPVPAQDVCREQIIDHPASYVFKAAIRETVRHFTPATTEGQNMCRPIGDLAFEFLQRHIQGRVQ